MVMDKLSSSLRNTLKKIAGTMFVDEKLVDELVKDIQRALLQSDVNVQLVFNLSKDIKKRALDEKPAKGISAKEHLIKIVYEELVKFLGKEQKGIEIKDKKPFKIMMVGLFGSGKCVHKDSKIPLSNGEIMTAEKIYERYRDKEIIIEDGSIIDIEKENLTVPSFNPETLKIEEKKVTRLWKLNGKDLLQIYLDNGNDFSVRVTPEHPFFALRDNSVKKIRADELTEEDVIAVPFNYETVVKEQNLFNELKNLDLDIRYKTNTTQVNIKKEILHRLKFNRNYCQLTADFKLGITPICLVDSINAGIVEIKKRYCKKFIKFPVNVTQDLAEFVGYVIGDGHLGKNYIEITNEDPEIIHRIIQLSEKLFGLSIYIKEDKRTKSTKQLVISSKTLVEILNKLFEIPIGKKGKNLRIPKQIQKSDNATVREFLRAYFDCDASPAYNSRNIELCSESKEVITDTSYLLNRFGIISSISKKIIDNISYWRLYISGRYAENYTQKIGFIVKHKKERSEQYSLIGTIQGCGDQDMIALGNSLKVLRHNLGFTIGEIQEYVTSYGTYERIGEISRESLSKLIALYYLKKKGNIHMILEHLQDKNSQLSNAFINGFSSYLKKENFIVENNGQLLLTQRALDYLNISINKQELLGPFRNLVRSDVCWIKIKKIENIGKVDFVYDLTVEDNHSFIADNIIVHNTTTIGKLAKYYSKRNYKVAAIGLDVHRPAAPEQLEQVCKQVNIPAFVDKKEKNALKIYEKFEKEYSKYDILIIDTAGRDALSKDLIEEIENLNKKIKPDERLLVISADIGQAAQKQAEQFHQSVDITGVIATKMDGTAKAGGALSACAITKAPIKFIGVGEKIDDLEAFDPEGFVSRLLGMGDLKALLEKAQDAMDVETAEDLGKKFLKGDFNFLDLYEQMQAMKKMGPLSKIMELVPGMGNMNIPKEMLQVQDDKLKKWKFIMQSMTKEELEEPDELLDRGRIDRIAKGSGTTGHEVRELLKQYRQSKKVVKLMKGMDDEKDMNKLMKKFQGKMPKGFGM